MGYNTSALRAAQQTGDPFLGGILKGATGILGGVLPGPLGGAARLANQALGGGRKRQRRPRPQIPMRGLGFPPSGVPGFPPSAAGFGQPKRRRTNYSNQKALRRAIRRVGGYARQQSSMKKALRKAAREAGVMPTHRSRRDLGPGHRHIR